MSPETQKTKEAQKYLKRKITQYLKTCDNTEKDETYATDRELSEDVFKHFLDWLKDHP